MTPEEQWRDIPGFEGRYQASDLGRVRSVDRRVAGRVLRQGLSRDYRIVHLYPQGTIAVHLIVARTFVPNPNGLPEVNHCDGMKENCRADNLEWITKSGNQLHAVAFGLKPQAKRVRAPSGAEYPSITQAAKAERVAQRTAAKWAAP